MVWDDFNAVLLSCSLQQPTEEHTWGLGRRGGGLFFISMRAQCCVCCPSVILIDFWIGKQLKEKIQQICTQMLLVILVTARFSELSSLRLVNPAKTVRNNQWKPSSLWMSRHQIVVTTKFFFKPSSVVAQTQEQSQIHPYLCGLNPEKSTCGENERWC